jgi:hypothetical protein
MQRGATRRTRPQPRQAGEQLNQPLDFRPGDAFSHQETLKKETRMAPPRSFSPCGRRWREAPDEGFIANVRSPLIRLA